MLILTLKNSILLTKYTYVSLDSHNKQALNDWSLYCTHSVSYEVETCFCTAHSVSYEVETCFQTFISISHFNVVVQTVNCVQSEKYNYKL
jgi:hypothetical protein